VIEPTDIQGRGDDRPDLVRRIQEGIGHIDGGLPRDGAHLVIARRERVRVYHPLKPCALSHTHGWRKREGAAHGLTR
jgi:hypothetical protein